MSKEVRRHLRLATRKSPLAFWQAERIKLLLEQAHPGLQVELIGLMTQADKFSSLPIEEIGNKGAFVKELEKALLARRVDIAVHSVKDMTARLPAGLTLAAICEREDPRDVFLSKAGIALADLPAGACIGTASPRRQYQLRAFRPDLKVKALRGNIGTRLRKLSDGDFDGLILAAAGLKRLGEVARIQEYLTYKHFLPTPGQGALCIEAREEDQETLRLLAHLDCTTTRPCIEAERYVVKALGGDCQQPIAAYAQLLAGELCLAAQVGEVNEARVITVTKYGKKAAPLDLGKAVVDELFAQGAAELLS